MSEARYEFHELIATGGMGEVWHATDTMLNRDVAIKLLKPEFADDPVNRSRFDSEARHAAALHHPHVAAVYDVGEMPTASGLMRPYMVMEYVDGKPLSDLLRDGRPLDPEAVRDLLGQAGDALAAAHRAGIVHRDVKPANLLVTRDRQVKVTDFGIARAQASSSITGTGQVMGTPQYLSPEQARGERATSASDVYSLGVVAFECLTGTRPFQKESPVATAIAHLHDPVPDMPDDLPPDLVAVVRKALEKSPQDRYADAAAFTAALRDAGSSAPRHAASAAGAGAGAAAATAVLPGSHRSDDADEAADESGPAGEDGATGGAGDDPEDGSATSVLPVAGGVPPTQEPRAVRRDDDERSDKRGGMGVVLLLLALLATALVAWLLLHDGADDDKTPQQSTPSVTQSPAPVKKNPKPTPAPTQQPQTIDLDPDAYIGRNIDEVLTELRGKGLSTSAAPEPNDGSHDPDTVSRIEPVDDLAPGDLVTVTYWGEAPEEKPSSPTPSPSGQPTPSEQPTPTDQATNGSSAHRSGAGPHVPGSTDSTVPQPDQSATAEGTL